MAAIPITEVQPGEIVKVTPAVVADGDTFVNNGDVVLLVRAAAAANNLRVEGVNDPYRRDGTVQCGALTAAGDYGAIGFLNPIAFNAAGEVEVNNEAGAPTVAAIRLIRI